MIALAAVNFVKNEINLQISYLSAKKGNRRKNSEVGWYVTAVHQSSIVFLAHCICMNTVVQIKAEI